MGYPSSAKTEFYRDTDIKVAPVDMEIHLLAKMPKEDSTWYRSMLVTIGNLLIATGVKLKSSAKPAVTFFQETL